MKLERARQIVGKMQQVTGQLEALILAAEMNQESSLSETGLLSVVETWVQQIEKLERSTAPES